LALKSDGTVVAWGLNSLGQTSVPASLSGVIAIAGGESHSLALRSDGTVVPWGDNGDDQATAPGTLRDIIAVAACGEHSLAIKSDGTVVAWGGDYYGESTAPAGLSGVIGIAAGQAHSLALKSDGTVVAWGYNYNGQITVPAGLRNVVAVAAGWVHSLALKSDGTIVAWGAGGPGQSGPVDCGQSTVPSGLSGVIAIAGGAYHSLALKSDGTVVGWGYDLTGQTDVPMSLTNVIAISAGYDSSLALKRDGMVVAWGGYDAGEATPPAALSKVIAISAEDYHSLALKSDGTVVPWGYNIDGLGTVPAGLSGVFAIATGDYQNLALVAEVPVGPPLISLTPQSQAADVGSTVNFLVDASGAPPLAYQWFFNGTNAIAGATFTELLLTDVLPRDSGAYTVIVSNAFGAITSSPAILTVLASPPAILESPRSQTVIIGRFLDFTVRAGGSLPQSYQWFFDGGPISDANRADLHLADVQFSQAGAYTVVVTNAFGAVTSAPAMLRVIPIPPSPPTGTVVTWGYDSGGENNVPSGLSNVIAIAAGAFHNLALKSDGTVVAWGHNSFGEASVPAGLSNVIAIGAAGDASLALKFDGTVVAWGYNGDGWSTVPPGLRDAIAIAAGGAQNLALKSDGTVVAWGSTYYGQSVPPDLSGVIAIAAGSACSLAFKSDGTVVAWGSPQLLPIDLSDVIALDANLALKADGTVLAWGDNHLGQTNVPPGLSGVISIAAGFYHNLALKSDGTVVAWGAGGPEQDSNQNYGQSTTPLGLHAVIAIAAGGWHSLALVAEPPSEVTFPLNQTAEMGATVRFRPRLLDTPVPYYQWFFNRTQAITPATTNWLLLLTNIQPAQAGVYSVVVTNITGSLTSAPATLSVIPAVPRRMVPALTLMGQPGSSLNLDFTASIGPTPSWAPLDIVSLTSTSQWYFDLSTPLPPQRFYRARQPGPTSVTPALYLHLLPALTLTGTVGSFVRVDYINQVGPTDAWVTLNTVTLTNTSQLYFDLSAIGQPPRLWRVMPVP
jgi:alpha-tubulin suppressor-like RCC1 family protein